MSAPDLELYHGETETVLVQRAADRVRLIRWDRERDAFEAGDWQTDTGAPIPVPRAVSAPPSGPAPHCAPGDERVIAVAGHRLYATLVHCACHREWALLRDFSA